MVRAKKRTMVERRRIGREVARPDMRVRRK
jgi:hypothetical protein